MRAYVDMFLLLLIGTGLEHTQPFESNWSPIMLGLENVGEGTASKRISVNAHHCVEEEGRGKVSRFSRKSYKKAP